MQEKSRIQFQELNPYLVAPHPIVLFHVAEGIANAAAVDQVVDAAAVDPGAVVAAVAEIEVVIAAAAPGRAGALVVAGAAVD